MVSVPLEVTQLRPPPSCDDLLPESVLLRIFEDAAEPLREMPPPVKPAELPEIVESWTTRLLTLGSEMPPPSPVAVFPAIVVRSNVTLAALVAKMAPPSCAAPVVELLFS